MKIKIIKINCIVILAAILLSGCSVKGPKETSSSNNDNNKQNESAYVDHLSQKYADYKEIPYGLDITKKTGLVAICYSTWFNPIVGTGKSTIYNITEILKGNQKWGGSPAFHYWAEPALGYYRSDNKDVIRTHMTQLQDAGIDFIIVDNTNSDVSWKKSTTWRQMVTLPDTALLDTIVQMRSEGLKTPYVVFWNAADETKKTGVIDLVYNEFYKDNDKYKDCFVYWEGKPFMITTGNVDVPVENFTTRKMWGLNKDLKTSEWSFLLEHNKSSKDADGFNEQMCVCTALQESYMSDATTAIGRKNGETFYKQWKRAFEQRPKIVSITWWNEWAAQRFLDEKGNSRFVDNYNGPYSRDIEPMKGGHGDTYYKWMSEYIKAYKAKQNCPELIQKDGFNY